MFVPAKLLPVNIYTTWRCYFSGEIQMFLGFEKISNDGLINGHGITGKLRTTTARNFQSAFSGIVGNAIHVNAVNQWVTFDSHKDRCFSNTSLCDQGFSLAFWLKLGERTEGSGCKFVLNQGGETEWNTSEVQWIA